MPDHPASIHVLGGRQFGGADQFYVRLIRALREAGQDVTAINRVGSPVAQALNDDDVPQVHFPFANSFDAWTVWRLRALVAQREPCVVQTYMGRATRFLCLALLIVPLCGVGWLLERRPGNARVDQC